MRIKTGYMPNGEYQTFYRAVGEKTSEPTLVMLHGGPGSTHNYLEIFDELAIDRQVVMYDQLGCGYSSIPNDDSLWKMETWLNELIALCNYLHLDDIILFGQSWGGMLLIEYLCTQSLARVKGAILSSTLPASQLWGEEQLRLINLLPEEQTQVLLSAIANNKYEGELYQAALDNYMQRHSADLTYKKSDPECLKRQRLFGKQSYEVAWGPNEFMPLGTLKNFDRRPDLHKLNIPVLITSGSNDLCTPYIAKTMYDLLPNAKWELFSKSRHLPFIDERSKYLVVIKEWLASLKEENNG